MPWARNAAKWTPPRSSRSNINAGCRPCRRIVRARLRTPGGEQRKRRGVRCVAHRLGDFHQPIGARQVREGVPSPFVAGIAVARHGDRGGQWAGAFPRQLHHVGREDAEQSRRGIETDSPDRADSAAEVQRLASHAERGRRIGHLVRGHETAADVHQRRSHDASMS